MVTGVDVLDHFCPFRVQRTGGRKMEKMGPVGGLIMSPY